MSFFKKVGRAVGGMLGIRSGQSGQIRDALAEANRQYAIQSGENLARRFQFEGAMETQKLFDETEELAQDLQRKDQAASQTKVEFAPALKRNFFSFGR